VIGAININSPASVELVGLSSSGVILRASEAPMRPLFRMWFLIVIACFVLNLSSGRMLIVLVGYAIAEYVDQRLAKRTREKWIADVMYGWDQCADGTEYEEKGNLTRVKLTGQNQIVAARVADLLRGAS